MHAVILRWDWWAKSANEVALHGGTGPQHLLGANLPQPARTFAAARTCKLETKTGGGRGATKRHRSSAILLSQAKHVLEHRKGLGIDKYEQSRRQHIPLGKSPGAFSATTRRGFPGWAVCPDPRQLQQRSMPVQKLQDVMSWPCVQVTRLRKRRVKRLRGGRAVRTFIKRGKY
jgi:hypothetical protein